MTELIQSFFVIRHNSTGGFLPTLPRTRRAGHSYSEPVKLDECYTPRLFHKRSSAKIALTYWLQGKHIYYADGDGCSVFDKITPVHSRKREEMEIVQINLVLAP